MLGLSEEQRLRLVVTAVEAVRTTDPRAPVVLVIDQPCAEFMGERECDLSPLHFADALVRAEIGVAAISAIGRGERLCVIRWSWGDRSIAGACSACHCS
jgi:hypothetical protein